MDWKQSVSHLMLFLPLVFTLEIQTINSINELKEDDFGKSFPQHGLLLLYWFTSLIDIDQIGIIRFKKGSYDLVTDYPFQLIENPGYLPYIIPTGQRAYYSVDDLEDGFVNYLPFYITQDFYNFKNHEGQTVDRLIIVIDKWYTPVRVDQVYISEASKYNPPNVTNGNITATYKVGAQVLRQIATLTNPLDCQNKFLKEIFPHLGFGLTLAESMFGQPGLPLFLALSGYDLEGRYNITAQTWSCPLVPAEGRKSLCDTSKLELAIRTNHDGHAVISWHGLPSSILKSHTTVALFQSSDRGGPLVEKRIDGQASGALETAVALDSGLQIHLIKQDVSDTTIWRGPTFSDANRQLPVQVGNASASLMLFTRKGYAAARLFIRKSYATWKDDFYYSWVAFYSSPDETNENYLSRQWQWVTHFRKHKLLSLVIYDVYEYVSGTAITPGIQARFFLSEYDEVARTKAWDM
ncbi:uncharacterized protein LOC121717396 [Alosa sapidissima]|uniref:uncharacterized protein LOC121717396 n=1 Tax=Alosa sapidissima TaxID=34773 RepID=UPI001C090393|nr:uncharacterized protein LOC121717396 [Alosa sapidissima]XP_041958479.1 uncharacterized protein LOC121717396 [Alosa sapidissima]